MSVRVSTLVWERSRCTGPTFLLMLALADQANDEGYCWPKGRTLARRLRLKEERSVRKLVEKARDLGELTVYAQFKDGRQTSNRYQINLAHLRTLPDLWGEVQTDRGGGPNGPGGEVQMDRGGEVQTDRVITVSNNHQLNHQLPQGGLGTLPLPDWLPEEAWGDFLAHRKACRAPVTELSARRLLATLEKLRSEGHDPVQVIDQTISTGKWTGLFPLKGSAPRRAGRPATQADANERFTARMDDTRQAVKGVFDD